MSSSLSYPELLAAPPIFQPPEPEIISGRVDDAQLVEDLGFARI